MPLDTHFEAAKPVAGTEHADLGGLLDHAVPCTSSDARLNTKTAQQLQDEINLTMAAKGYPFKDEEKAKPILQELARRGTPYIKNLDFNEDSDLDEKDKAYISQAQNEKALRNYPGDNACSAVTDSHYRQHAKSGQDLLAGSDTHDLTADDIKKMAPDGSVSLEQVWKAKNEIYMRAGRPFASPALRSFAEQQGYVPRTNYSDADLSGTESGNIRLLSGVESYMRKNRMLNIDAKTLDEVVPFLRSS